MINLKCSGCCNNRPQNESEQTSYDCNHEIKRQFPQPDDETVKNIQLMKETNENTYRQKIIRLCFQKEIQHFKEVFPQKHFQNFNYLDSGSYSSVLRCFSNQINKTCVFKMIKLKNLIHKNSLKKKSVGSIETKNSCEDKLNDEHYYDVFQEILISQALSNLNLIMVSPKGYEFKAHCFPKLYKTSLVNGLIPLGKKNVKTKNEYIAICMEDCGISLQSAIKDYRLDLNQLASVCYQILFGMIVAEILYEYEHRDLHINNILVRKTKQEQITYVIKSKSYSVSTHGIRAFVIDNTFSRMRIGQNVYYTHLSGNLQKLVNNSKDEVKCKNLSDQDWIYVKMSSLARDNWAQWIPKTNIYWMRYMVERLLKSKRLRSQIQRYPSVVDSLNSLCDTLLDHCRLQDILENL